ncbi:Alkaline phosphatase synthesis sensor protein PhoR [Botrimarina colliarenosi]|uniref:histidine kinase n=1 Tax=Botrimarina colliarenosi TaxID=2528001 RepID=A0A5C6ACY3_9BACT|nr:HAMP domain-containing sensor histidine kinase [Botrimarina colliarenosi]TWT97035.1 Alkaline phosphatase synthesis sensor protein PhoR [Botrimarina colliarenosi]
MLRSRLFWKLFLGFTLVNLVATAALVAATRSWRQDEATALVRAEVRTAALLLADAASDWAREPTPARADALRLLVERAGLEVRVRRDANGEQLRVPAEKTDGRERTQARLRLGTDQQPLGDLWVEKPTENVSVMLARMWARYAAYVPFVGLAMVAAGYGVVAHLVGPVRSLNRAAVAMASGAYRQRAFVANRDELGALANSFNRMSEELGQRLSQLQESDRRQATVLGGMIEGVVAVDERQRVLFANDAAGKLFHFIPVEVERRPLLEVVRNHALHQAVKTAIATRTPQRLEIEWDERILSVQVTPLVGEPAGAVVVLHDTTELRRLENLRRDFVANVSHELKTPLSTIKANAETLLLGAVDDKVHRTKFLEGIGAQSERLEALIQDMLTLARIESAQQPFDIASVLVAQAVASCLLDYRPRAEAKEIALTTVEPAGSPNLKVRADRNGLQVILSNLVDNAIKYTPSGGQVRIAWESVAVNDVAMVRIEVADTGNGIPEEKLARVFERFYRIDEARSRELGGTGLGLSIVKHLTQSFGGDVAVTSRPNEGAVFVVTLPGA